MRKKVTIELTFNEEASAGFTEEYGDNEQVKKDFMNDLADSEEIEEVNVTITTLDQKGE